MELIQSDERLREERKKSKKNRDKYVGVSSEGKVVTKWTEHSPNSMTPKKLAYKRSPLIISRKIECQID